MIRTLRFLSVALLCAAPTLVFASASAAIGAFNPSTANNTVGIGIPISFSMITSGFTNPTYYLVDSFPGGVTTVNIDSQGNFHWTPNKDNVGAHTLTVTVSDSQGNSANASKTITVIAPTVSASDPLPGSTVRFGTPVSFTLSSTGFSAPTYTVGDGSQNSSATPSNFSSGTNTFTWTPIFQDIGVHTFTITARDSQNTSVLTKTITVEGTPSISVVGLLPGNSVPAKSTLTFSVTTTSFTSPTVTVVDQFYLNSTTASSTLTMDASHHVSWTPVYNDLGVHTFMVSATDSAGHAASTQFSVTVGPPAVSATPALVSPVVVAPQNPPGVVAPSKPPAHVFSTYLGVGSRGTEVTFLQQKLIALGLLSGAATGYYGSLTKRAVQALQKSAGLTPLGFVGPGTRVALNK